MVIKYNRRKNRDKKAWQTFHRIEGPGKTLLNLLKLFPFSSKKLKLIKFNNNFDLHLYLNLEYKKKFLNYKQLIRKTKKRILLKFKGTRFRAVNKHFKMLLVLVNFLNESFYSFFYYFFYSNFNELSYFFKNNKNSNNAFYTNISNTIIKNIRKGDKKKIINNNKNKIKDSDGSEISKLYDFYLLVNNGLLEIIGYFNDSILLKFKKKIFLYYYNSLGLESTLNKLSTKLKFFKKGKNFFFSQNIEIFNYLTRFLEFFKVMHFSKSVSLKNKLTKSLDAGYLNKKKTNYLNKYSIIPCFYKKKLFSNNICLYKSLHSSVYYYYDFFYYFFYPYSFKIKFKPYISFTTIITRFVNFNYNTNILKLTDSNYYLKRNIRLFTKKKFNKKKYFIDNNFKNNFSYYFYCFYKKEKYIYYPSRSTSTYNKNNKKKRSNFYTFYSKLIKNYTFDFKNFNYYNKYTLFNNYFFYYNIKLLSSNPIYRKQLKFINCKESINFFNVFNKMLKLKNSIIYKLKTFKTAEWHKKFDSMVMFERFRFSSNFYMYDMLYKLKSSMSVFYKIYFYNYLYELMDTWDLLDYLPKKKKTEITRWLKKIQKFLSNTNHRLLKSVIKNFIWKDHKVLNKLVKSHSIWKGKKFINARHASGSYYYAINFFFLENLNILKLRLATNDLIYDNFSILDELLLNYKFISKTDKIRNKNKRKPSAAAKKFYDILNKQRESKGIFYCKFARMSYNLNNTKSTKKYLLKLSKLLLPIKTYYRLYDKYIFNLNNYKNSKTISSVKTNAVDNIKA